MSPSRPPEPPAADVACCHCGSRDVEIEAAFGGSLMARQYWCRGCRTVFEYVKWEPPAADPGAWLRDHEGPARAASAVHVAEQPEDDNKNQDC